MTPDESIAQLAAARLVGAQIAQMAIAPESEVNFSGLIVLTNDGRLFVTYDNHDDNFGDKWDAISLPPDLLP